MPGDLTYEEVRERIDAWIRKNAPRKVSRARRIERSRVRQAGGGKAIAALILEPASRRRKAE